MSERWILTPAGGAPLVLPLTARDGGCQVVGIDTPSPPARDTWAPRPEGALRTVHEYENREITLQLQLFPPADQWATTTHDFGRPPAEAEGDGPVPGWTGAVRRVAPNGNPVPPMISDLVATVAAEPGTVRRVLDDGTFIDFDVLASEITDAPKWDLNYYAAKTTTLTIKLTCAPFGRGRERLLGQGTLATGQRFLTIGGLQVPGDVAALARLEYTASSTPQRSLLYAIDQPAGATSDTLVQVACSSLLAPEASEPVTVAGGIAAKQTLMVSSTSTAWRTLSLLRRSTGAQPIALTGTHRVFVRVRSSTTPAAFSETGETFRVRLRWAAGAREGGLSENQPVTIPTGPWVLVDLGLVSVPDDVGTLDGTIEVTGSVPGVIWSDVLLLVPASRSGIASASLTPAVAGVPSVVDPLRGSGSFGGSTAQLGGQWASIGPGPAWFRTSNGAQKDVSIGDGTPNTSAASGSAITVPIGTSQATVSTAAPVLFGPYTLYAYGLVIGDVAGITAMLSDAAAPATGWAVAMSVWTDKFDTNVYLETLAGGVRTGLHQGQQTATGTAITYRDRPFLAIRPDGTASAAFGSVSVAGTAPGGAPATGLRAGLFSHPYAYWGGGQSISSVSVRDFVVTSAVAPDASLFPGKSAQISTAQATRTTAADLSGTVSAYRGDRPLLPPSGPAGRTARVVLGTSGGDLRDGREVGVVAPFTGRVFATPRYLQLPDTQA